MRFRRLLAVGSTVLLVAGLITLGATAAEAHTPTISDTCSDLSVNLQSYEKTQTNTVSVTIDGVVVATNSDFGSSFKHTYKFSDKTVAHTWTVVYTAGDDPTGANGWSGSQSGTSTPCVSHDNPKVPFCHAKPADTAANGWNTPPAADPGIIFSAGHATEHDADIIPAFDYWTESHGVWTLNHYAGKNLTTVWGGATGAEILANGCSIPDLKDATAAVSTTAATCSTAELLVLGDITNATWGTPTRTTGPGSYSVTATATDGHAFADGSTTKVFTGTLDGVLSPTSQTCAPPPCLPASQVSYTYNSVTNSGVITVTAMDGHSDTLCSPFWVTAASWTFDGNTMWPQTLDKWNPANSSNAINSVGTYSYGADVTCGQGDIYATFTNPGVPYPTAGILNGPNNPYAEHFLHQMGFSGPNPTYTVQDAGSCNPTKVTTVPVATFTDMCGTANDSYSAPADTDGIHYSVVDSRVDGVGTVTVTAAPQSGYVFADGAYTGPWSHTFTDEVCPIEVVTVPLATFTDACGTANDSYSAPTDTAEIDYTVVDSRVNGVGTVTVSAAPQVGYVFADGAYTGPWSHTFTNADCVVDNFVVPDPTDQSCSVTGDGIPVSGYIWVDLGGNLGNEISYQIVGGTYDYTATQEINNLPPGTYTVTATAKPGFTLDSSKASSWTLTIGSAENCDLITHPLISTTATFKNITCSAGGSYTLAATEGVLWFVNGSSTPTAPGTYHVTSATTVNIQAQTTGPDYGWEQDAQTSWTFDFTTPADCLPTLAFTGSDSAPIGLLLAGGFLLLGGTIIAFERRLRKTAR